MIKHNITTAIANTTPITVADDVLEVEIEGITGSALVPDILVSPLVAHSSPWKPSEQYTTSDSSTVAR